MKIDIKRLKIDADYWEECGAPEDATHYDPGGEWDDPSFMKFGDECMFLDDAGIWDYYGDGTERDEKDVKERSIPRPTKQSQEWDGEGLPPVGCDCEVWISDTEWQIARVVGHDEGEGIKTAVCRVDYGYHAFSETCIRPARTKERRLRDKLAVEIWGAYGGGRKDAFIVADAILAKYELKERK